MRKIDLCFLPSQKYRSCLEIIALMIGAMRDGGASRFSLMKKANTNYSQIKKYVTSLTQMGFVETNINNGQVLYTPSYEGLAFLRQYHILLEMLAGKNGKTYPMMITPPLMRKNARALNACGV